MTAFTTPDSPTDRLAADWISELDAAASGDEVAITVEHLAAEKFKYDNRDDTTTVVLTGLLDRLVEVDALLVANAKKNPPQDWNRFWDTQGVLFAFRMIYQLQGTIEQLPNLPEAVQTFPPSQYFRIAVDRYMLSPEPGEPLPPSDVAQIHQGAFQLDDEEPGYLAGFLSSFDAMLQVCQDDLTVDGLIQELHEFHARAVIPLVDRPTRRKPSREYRDNADAPDGVHFALRGDSGLVAEDDHRYPNATDGRLPRSLTRAGRRELLHTIAADPAKEYSLQGWATLKKWSKDGVAYDEPDEDPPPGQIFNRRLHLEPKTRAEVETLVRDIFERFIVGDTNDTANIALCVQRLEQAHVFGDGNIRSMQVLLNRLLLKAGGVPTLLWDPNCLDGYDIATLVSHIEYGQWRWLSYSNDPDDPTAWWSFDHGNDPQNHLGQAPAPAPPQPAPAPAPGPAVAAASAATVQAATDSTSAAAVTATA